MGRIVLAALVAAALWGTSAQAAERARFGSIVVFKDGAALDAGPARADPRAADRDGWGYLNARVVAAVQAREARLGFVADHVYSAALRGFAARLDADQLRALEADPEVAWVEPDVVAIAVGSASAAKKPVASEPEQVLPWGIDTIDADASSALAGNGAGTVTGVRAYVIDTGVDVDQPDLNVAGHVNFASGPNKDCNGHGTHVAGTIAAKDNAIDVVGVAPGIPIVGVKVLGCGGSGTLSGVIKGIDWVTANAVKPAVANMSLSSSASDAVDKAVKASVDSGVFYAVAASNDGEDACLHSPARAGTYPGVLTVAATKSDDTEASFSNYGACVGLWAPGVNVLSTRLGGGTTTYSGTSMATPHVAGGAALRLSGSPGASPAQVESTLVGDAANTGTLSKDGAPIERLDVHRY